MKISKIKGIYIENNHQMKSAWLSEKTYSKSISALILVCSDVIIFDHKEKIIYLAKRKIEPMKGWWFIGGRRSVGENSIEAAIRNFRRETSLKINPGRLKFITTIENIWENRKEKPKKIGKHDLEFIFAIELNKKEIDVVFKNLDPKEYHSRSLEKFNRKRLVQEKVHPGIIEIYDKIFKK